MAELIPLARRRVALGIAVESYGGRDIPTEALLQRAVKIEAHLWPDTPAERPHHACSQPGCTTPSGKTACHTCGEMWPCSAELRKRDNA